MGERGVKQIKGINDILSLLKANKFLSFLLLAAAGIILMSFSSLPLGEQVENENRQSVSATALSAERALAGELEAVLSKIKGAGEVTVSVSFAEDGKTEYLMSEDIVTQKEIGEGKESEQKTQKSSPASSSLPVVAQSAPELRGVLVVAEGAGNSMVKRQLTEAVAGLLAVPYHKIIVLEAE